MESKSRCRTYPLFNVLSESDIDIRCLLDLRYGLVAFGYIVLLHLAVGCH